MGKYHLLHLIDAFHDMNSLMILVKSTLGIKLLFLHQYYVNEYCISTVWYTNNYVKLYLKLLKFQ